MTSKEVEKMKNEEVLEILLGNVDYKDYSSETMRLVNSCVSRLWEILERLEMLESNSDKVIKDSVKLINKNLELQKENEKLKKEKEQIKEWVKNKISYLKNGVFLTEHKYVEGAILILKEFSKEVLGE